MRCDRRISARALVRSAAGIVMIAALGAAPSTVPPAPPPAVAPVGPPPADVPQPPGTGGETAKTLDQIVEELKARRAAALANQPPPPGLNVADPPLPPGAADDLMRRMRERRAAQVAGEAAQAAGAAVPPAAASQPSTVSSVVPAAPPDPRWTAIIKQLASADFAEREAAQKDLDQSTYRDLPMLRTLASTDAEVQARIQGRIAAIEENLALNPPPISLEVTNGSMNDVGALLKEALGVSVDANGPGPFTVNLKEKPFWEVYGALSAQHGIMLQMYDTMRLYQTEPGLRKMTVYGSVAVFPQTISRTRTVDLQKDAGQQVSSPNLSINYTVAVDPRVKLVGSYQPQLTDVIDDAGNVLLKRQAAPPNFFRNMRSVGLWQLGEQLAIPEKPGTKIVSAKGQVRLRVLVAEEHVDVDAIETKVKQPIEVGGKSIVFDRLDVKDGSLDMSISVRGPAGAPERVIVDGNGVRVEPTPVTVTLVDAAGTRIWSGSVSGTSGIGMGRTGYKTPLKVSLSVPTRTRDVTVDFEMKDLPLP